MTFYIAFLRGVNVSGKNSVSMPLLKQALIAHGFLNVKTYINSGNVLFMTHEKDQSKLQHTLESIISATFALTIPTRIISLTALKRALDHAPTWWGDGNKDTIHYCLFTLPPATSALIMSAIQPLNPTLERAMAFEDIIFWSAPRHTFPKSKLAKTAASSFNTMITIRNANTVRKMVALVASEPY